MATLIVMVNWLGYSHVRVQALTLVMVEVLLFAMQKALLFNSKGIVAR
jgi:hypothetical protein